jgi:hypothetical protein
MRVSRGMWMAGLALLWIASAAQISFSRPQAPDSAQVAVVKGESGPCTADFVVSDASGKGVYGAKIELNVAYGFMGLHKLDATANTNYEGKARFEGLPDRIKKTAEFRVSHGDQSKALPYDPLADCHPRHEVVLGQK